MKSDNIDWTTLSAITIQGTGNDTATNANAIVNLASTCYQRGAGLTRSGNTVVIGAEVETVRVSASVFMTYRSVNYGWIQLQKNGTNVDGARSITNLASSSYGSVNLPVWLLDVQQGDALRLVSLDPANIRPSNSWMTVEQVA